MENRWSSGFWMAAGAAFGAACMYLFDPSRGKTRRARIEEKARRAARRGGYEMTRRAEDVLNRAKGAVAEARAGLAGAGCADDELIADRVRSRMGHVTEHAEHIQTQVNRGVVSLRGTVSRAEKHRLVEEARAVPGVKRVQDLLVSRAS